MLFQNLFTILIYFLILTTTLIEPIHTATTSSPSLQPTITPTSITNSPSKTPTITPTITPTAISSSPTPSPTSLPTNNPTPSPTSNPTPSPTNPSKSPTPSPTKSPTVPPTTAPTTSPTLAPSSSPTYSPSSAPTDNPTKAPTNSPTAAPTSFPTFKSGECVYEHTSWQDWQYISNQQDISKYIEDDGSIMLKVLSIGNTRQFLFTYQTEMVFTDNTITWFELEYKCGGTSCYDASWGIINIDPTIYIYDEESNYIAIWILDTSFKISNGANGASWGSHACSQSLLSSGVTIVNDDIANVMNDMNPTKWTQSFGAGLDRYGNQGGLEDGRILIRFRNDEKGQRSYLNIRVKYGNYQEETSYLCAIDGSFATNSNISFGVMGRNNNDYYRIQYIDIKACSGYWDIPRIWCENNEPFDDQYNAWNNNGKYEIQSGIFIHGLFDKNDDLNQQFSPLVQHESVTIEFDLYYKTLNYSSGQHLNSWFKVVIDDQIQSIRAPHNMIICDNDWSISNVANYCNKHIIITETASSSYLNLRIYFYNPSLIGNDTIHWGFTNLCINQTHKITNNPTPTPTNPPTIPLSECNNYKTRLSDWDLIYNVSRTAFIPNGIQYVKFTPIISHSQYSSDWLFSVDTNLYFPTISTVPIWLNIEMNGFGAITNTIDPIQPIIVLSDGISFSAVHFTKNGISFYPQCGELLEAKPNTNTTLNELFNDPLEDWQFIRTTDYWEPRYSSLDPPVYNPKDIVLKYLSDPINNKTYLYIDRKFRVNSNYIKNLSYICYWDSIYTNNELTYFLAQTSMDDDYLIEDIEFNECTSYWDIPANYCDDVGIDIIKWSAQNTYLIDPVGPDNNIQIHGQFTIQQSIQRTVSTIFYHERIMLTAIIYTFGYATDPNTNITIYINGNNLWSEIVTISPILCLSTWNTTNSTQNQYPPLCAIPVDIEYIEMSNDPIQISIGTECENQPNGDCKTSSTFKWGFGSFCLDAQHQLTKDPTPAPTGDPTVAPSFSPSLAPTSAPSVSPTLAPSLNPTLSPTNAPSGSPTQPPSAAPTQPPTNAPSSSPTQPPTNVPSYSPTLAPSGSPTQPPSNAPSYSPTNNPSNAPSFSPSIAPSLAPSYSPSNAPSIAPSLAPSNAPSLAPSLAPSGAPTGAPHSVVTLSPTEKPTDAINVTPAPTTTEVPDNSDIPNLTHPPVVINAYFNSEGTVITITFDIETNIPSSDTGYATCHYVLSLSDDSILGVNTHCVWKSRTIFVITLDTSTSTIIPTDNLRTKQNVVDRWSIFSQGSQQYFKIQAPTTTIPIESEINGPNIVGQCAVFTLFSSSLGVKDDSASKWELIAPKQQWNGQEFIWYGGILNVDANNFGNYLGDIQISLSVTNWIGMSDTTIHTLKRDAIDAPVLSIAGKTVQILDTSNEFTLISNAYLASCTDTNSWNIEFKWVQITDHNEIINAKINTSKLITPITYTDILTLNYDSSSSLSIPAFGLKDDSSYLFYVYASNGGDFNNTNITSSAYVIVTAFDIPIAKTVYQKTIGTNAFDLYFTDLFEFPRGSAPDNDHYTYKYQCSYTKLPEHASLSSADKNYIHDFGYIFIECPFANITHSNVTNNGQFPMSDTSPFDLHFGTFTLIPNSVYIITLEIIDNNNYFPTKSSSVSLFTKPAELPEITILSTIASMNPDDYAVISMGVSPNDAIIVWRPTDAASNLLPTNLYSVSYIGIKEEIDENNNKISNLILNPDFDLDIDTTKSCANDETSSLQSGIDYSFTIWSRKAGTPNLIDFYASTNVVITINSPPTGGSCSVTPTNGQSIVTKFEFSCKNWYDPDGDSQALTYNFMYNDVFLGEDFSSSSYLASVIGGTDVNMMAYIKDEDGLNTCYDIPMNVTSRFNGEDEEYIKVVITGDLDKIRSYLLTQSIANTLQNALAVSEMIRELSRKLENGNFTKTLNEYKNNLMQYVIQSQNNSAKSINSALQHIQTVSAMLNEEENDTEDSQLIDFGTADEILLWIEEMLENYQKESTSDSNILLPPMLSLLEKIQNKALNNNIANDTDSNDGMEILDSAVDITMNSFTYGLQNRVLGEQITHNTPIYNGVAMRTRSNPDSFGCPGQRFGTEISFPNRFFAGLREHARSSVTCGIVRMRPDYYGLNPYVSTPIFDIDVLSIDNNGEVTAANPAVSSTFQRRLRRRNRRRRLQDVNITDNSTLNACETIIFSMDLIGNASHEFFDDIIVEANKTIYIPTCKFYDVSTASWSAEGCKTLNYTQTTVWCSCQHFTSFAGIAEAFKPQVNIITTKDLRNLTPSNMFDKYPTAFITICVLHFITLVLLIFLPKPDDTPLLARADVLQNKLRRAQAMERWKMQRFVRVLQSQMSLTRKLLRLFAYRLQDDHSVLSLFARSEGTNYGTTQRVMILHLYLISVMAVSALFYGQSTNSPFGDTILAIYASILSSIPVFTIRYIFQYSRPKETKEFVEWENKLLAKKLIELRKQNYYRTKALKKKGRLDLTMADSVDVEDVVTDKQNVINIRLEIPKTSVELETIDTNIISAASPGLTIPDGDKIDTPAKSPTIGYSHKSAHLRELTYNYDDEELSESEQHRLMANIFNLENDGNKTSTMMVPQPNFVVSMENQNLHHRVQSVIRRHLSMFVNPEMHKSLLDEVQEDKEEEEEEEEEEDNMDNNIGSGIMAIDDNKQSDFLGLDITKLFKAEEEYGKEYDITIYSAPLGIIFQSDAHGYNTFAKEIANDKCLMYESAGIEIGMILSNINNINVLGLPFNIVKKKLMESRYPIKLTFMSEKTILVRFDWVLSAASFIKHALNKGYDKSNIVKFLAHEGMSKLEVRSAVHLKNEHSELLPRVKIVTNSSYLRNEMNGNAMYSLFMESEWAQKQKLLNPNNTNNTGHKHVASALFHDDDKYNNNCSDDEDSEIHEAMGDMLNMFGLDPFHQQHNDDLNAPMIEKSKHDKIGTMKRISNRVSGLFAKNNNNDNLLETDDKQKENKRISKIVVSELNNIPSSSNEEKEEKDDELLPNMLNNNSHLQMNTMIINPDEIKLTDDDLDIDKVNQPQLTTKTSKLKLLGNQTSAVPRHSKLMTCSETAHIFLSQLELIKLNSSDSTKIPNDCYTTEYFIKAMNDADIDFNETEIDEIMQEMMDVDKSIEYGITLVSTSSLNEFIDNGGKSESSKQFLDLIMDDKFANNNNNTQKNKNQEPLQFKPISCVKNEIENIGPSPTISMDKEEEDIMSDLFDDIVSDIDENDKINPSIPSMNAPMMNMNMNIDTTTTIRKSNDFSDDIHVSRIADILAARLKDRKYKDFRQNLPTKQRRKLLKYYYPLPRYLKPVGWIFLILFAIVGCFVILNYGLKFDVLFYANIPFEDNIYLQSECPSNLTDISINEWMQYAVDKRAIDEFEQPNFRGNADGSFGDEVTDSRRFVLVIGLSVIQSLLLWQPVIIFCFSILIIVNYVAGKSADMHIKDYFIAFFHILFCQFCRNYRSYTREQENNDSLKINHDQNILSTINEDEINNRNNNESVELSSIPNYNDNNNNKKNDDHYHKKTETFTTTLKNSAPLNIQFNDKKKNKKNKLFNRKRVASTESESSKSNLTANRSSISSKVESEMISHSQQNTPDIDFSNIQSSSRGRGRSGSRSRSHSRTEGGYAVEPVAYRFINGFDSIYNENKFESLANALATHDNNFDWNEFGIALNANSPLVEQENNDKQQFQEFVDNNNDNDNNNNNTLQKTDK